MIKARALSKRYGATVAVDDLSFDVPPGMVTGFLGPNGAGKSTTMRMILGLDRPDGGSVTVGGKPYRGFPAPLHEVGALLEAKAVHGGRTAYQHLRWIARAGGISKHRVDEVLGIVGLSDVAGRRIGGYSLGMSQRLGIATALLGDPGTLLFDEPVNGLDPEGIRWIRELLKQLAAEGRTVFVSSHLMSEMEDTADHVLVIGKGRLIANMSTAELTRTSPGSHVHVVSPQAEQLADLLSVNGGSVTRTDNDLLVDNLDAVQIGEIAATHGICLHELSPRKATLEAAFMALTHDSVDYHAEVMT
jgi:ABC-2 type transport system ATP-binding protein